MKSNIKLFFLFATLVIFGQFAKYVFPDTICNKNLAWNIPFPDGIFYIAWIIVIAVLIYLFLKTKNYYQKIFLVLVFSGAVSNIIDRIRLGCVVDYIDLKFWPVFNLGDVYITVGILFFVIASASKQSRVS